MEARETTDAEKTMDLLDRLMQANDPESGTSLDRAAIADNVLTFLAAGHETTANALTWILYLLALFPEAEQRVLDEIETACPKGVLRRDQFGDLAYTRAVIHEAMRLYPPVPFIGREALGDDEIDDHVVPAGRQIVISPWVVHRHRLLWDEPDLFRPERFLGDAGRQIPRGAFIPFGLGPRICIGQGFAMQEILVVLSTILPRFSFRLLQPQHVVPLARIALRPAHGLIMVAECRRIAKGQHRSPSRSTETRNVHDSL